MKNYDNINNTLSVLTGSFGLANIEHVLGIIVLVLSIMNITFNVLVKVIRKYKEAKADGKITKDEVVDIIETGKEGYNEAKEEIEKYKRGE